MVRLAPPEDDSPEWMIALYWVMRKLMRYAEIRPLVGVPTEFLPREHWADRRLVRLPPLWLLSTLLLSTLVVMLAVPRVLASPTASGACMWYSVEAGDSLTSIAKQYQSSAQAISRANKIASGPKTMRAGQWLCIPIGGSTDKVATPRTTLARQAAPHSAVTQSLPQGPAHGEQAFIALALPYAQQAHAATGWPVSVILAQWGVEHGWSVPTFTGYNWGNVAALPGEQSVGGTGTWGSPARFSYAPTAMDGLREYVHVAHLSIYASVANAAASSGANAAAQALGRSPWDAGHYTNRNDPGSSLLDAMRRYDLYAFDR